MTKKSKAVFIIGMHRSGTSAITRSINLLGAYIGGNTDFVKPLIDNPTGYWERNDILDFNESVLYHLKRTWDTALPLPVGWHRSKEIKPFQDKLVSIIKSQLLDNKLWAVKDPRLSILFPLWKDVLKELGVDFSIIIAIRNPIDVSKSLRERNGFSDSKTFGIWFNYTIHAIRMSKEIPNFIMHYDKLIDNWESVLQNCAKNIGLPWPDDTDKLRARMNEFIRPELRHSVSGVEKLREKDVPKPVIELYETLMQQSELPKNEKEYTIAINRLFSEFSSYSKFYHYDSSMFWENEKKLRSAGKMIADIKSSIWWKMGFPFRKIGKLLSKSSKE